MAEHISVSQISNYVEKDIIIKGWVYNRTHKGKLAFLLIRDGSGFVQCVAFKGDLNEELFESITHLPQESSVIITGSVREDKRAPGIPGGYEVGIKDLQVVQAADLDYPMALKDHGVDFALDNRHLWIRMQSQWAILKVRVKVMSAVREYLDSNGFFNLDTPILTPAAAEGTTTLFGTEYFDEGFAYLAQTGQLYNEANIFAFGKVYCFGPTFRAEKSKTRRHMMEFWMVEPEMAYADLDECMRVGEEFVSYIVQTTLKNRANELKVLERDTTLLEKVVPPFPRISYDEAVEILNKEGVPIEWGDDFGAPHEVAVGERFQKPVFVHHYPTQCKAFYMEEESGRPEVSKSVDLLAPEGYGEIIGGGQRTASYELLERRIEEHNLPRAAYEWYLDLRRYGSVPHSGFGLVVERTIMWICGIQHIRETIPFPRLLGRMYP